MKISRSTVLFVLLMLLALPLSAQDRPLGLPSPTTSTRAVDSIINGGFETDTDWTERSLAFPGDIICNAACGTGGDTSGPHTGVGWVWLGGATIEASSVLQSLTLTPSLGTTDILHFWLWNGTSRRGNDRFYARYNNLQLLEMIEGDLPYSTGYSEVLINLAGFGTGTLEFAGTSFDGGTTNFSLDDVSLTSNVTDLVTNGGFEDGVTPLSGWTTPGASNDIANCTGSVFGSCFYRFKGSSAENSRLKQSIQLPAGDIIPTGGTLLGSFWAKTPPGGVLTATLKVKYNNGTTKQVKVIGNHSPLYNDNSGINPEWLYYGLPSLTLTRNVLVAPVLTITHKSRKASILLDVDNISVAYLPPVP